MQTGQREKRSDLAIKLGLGANTFLAIVKTFMGIAGHSPALLADGINSTSDVAYYVIVLIFMRLSHKPADEEHPYGHSQLESIAALIVGAFVLTTAVAIFWDSVNKVYDLLARREDFGGASFWALVVALFTVFTKVALTLITRKLGKETNNTAVLALAADHRNDTVAASAASVGIFLGRIGYAWIDPLAGSLVAIVILRTGIEILRESSADLMDTLPAKSLNQQVARAVKNIPGVQQVEEIIAHRFGPYLVLNITIGIDGAMVVAEGDRIASEVEHRLYEEIDLLRRVHVHYHPSRGQSIP